MIKTPLYDSTRACTSCPLRQGCQGPVPAVGPVGAYVMLVGEAPGRREDQSGEPFTGDAGRYLDSLLESIGKNREDVIITNTVKCRPKGNRTPTSKEAEFCAERWLDLEVEMFQPQIIVAMGATAIKHFLGEEATVERTHGIPVGVQGVQATHGGEFGQPFNSPTESDGEGWVGDFHGGLRGPEDSNGQDSPVAQGGEDPNSSGEERARAKGRYTGHRPQILPIWHPAAGFYNTSNMRFIQEDFQILGSMLNGEELNQPTDTLPVRYGVDAPVQLSGLVALDTETVDGALWSVQLSSTPGTSRFLSADNSQDKMVEQLKEVVVHNYLYDAQFIDLPENTHDTMVAAYNLGLPQGLKELAHRLCGMEMKSYTEVVGGYRKEKALKYLEQIPFGPNPNPLYAAEWPDPPEIEDLTWNKSKNKLESKTRKPQHITKKVKRIIADVVGGKENKDGPVDPWDRWHKIDPRERVFVEEVLGPMPDSSLDDVPAELALEYSCRDPDATLRVFKELSGELDRNGLRLAYELDRRTLPIALEMHQNGFKVDAPYLRGLGEEYLEKLLVLAEEIFEVVGKRFNPNSPPQLAQLLFEDLGFKPTKYTPTGFPSTESEELSKIDHPVIPKLKEYKHIAHLKDSFCDTLPEKVDEDGRIHATINVTRTETGRWSMRDPNLQQIPMRTELGRAIRKGFVAEEGNVLFSADYSQIEMRVAAHLSKCKSMIELFMEGRDVHTETAAQVFGISLAQVTEAGPKYRYPCKTLGFGVLYGLTAHGLANQMSENGLTDWTEDRCKEFIKDYYKLRPELYDWQEETKAFARRNGYVYDFLGRIRWTPEILCPIRKYRSAGERQAINMPIQATAADIMKMAMVQLWKAIDRNRYKWLLQVHDELIWEIPKGDMGTFKEMVVPLMEGAVHLSVPVLVESKVGENWGSMS